MYYDNYRYNPSLLSNYDTSGSYYNLMTESKHNVQEPKVVEMPLNSVVRTEKVRPQIGASDIMNVSSGKIFPHPDGG